MEKIFPNDATDKGVICKIYKHFIQFNNKNKTNNPTEKLTEEPKIDISPKDIYIYIQLANRHIKRCSTL